MNNSITMTIPPAGNPYDLKTSCGCSEPILVLLNGLSMPVAVCREYFRCHGVATVNLEAANRILSDLGHNGRGLFYAIELAESLNGASR